MWRFSFAVLIFFLASVWGVNDGPAGSPSKDTESSKVKFFPEVECSQAGGICIHREECPPEKVSEEGQCPKQSNLKAVCCHSLAISETKCQQLGGHCRQTCPDTIIIGRANDCPDGEKCCPLTA